MNWISVEEASQLSGYHPQHLRRLVRAQQIQAEKKGIMWWIDRDSLMALLESTVHSNDSRRGPKIRRK